MTPAGLGLAVSLAISGGVDDQVVSLHFMDKVKEVSVLGNFKEDLGILGQKSG